MTDLLYNVVVAVVAYTLFKRRAHGWSLVARFVALGGIALLLATPLAYAAIDHGYTDAMFAMMRYAAFVGFVHLPVIATVNAVRLFRVAQRTAVGLVVVALLLVGFAVEAFLIEPRALQVREVRLRSDKIARPLTIALVADLQTDGPTDYERDALRKVRERRPDLIVFSGDYVHASGRPAYAKSMVRFRDMLRELALAAPLGAIAVRGDVDPIGEWQAMFDGTAFVTYDETTRIERDPITVTALARRDSFDERLRIASSDRFHVVVGHGPDYALGDVDADLLLAGHTHGGQVQLPFLGPILTLSKVPRSWADGVTALSGGRTLIVSRGIGMERGYAPRLRFLCRPELVFVEVRPAE